MKWLGVIVLALVGLMIWIRVAPSDAARWHQPVDGDADRDFDGGVVRVVPGDLAALDRIIRATPRTRVLTGSVAEGRVTYVTRSVVWGFPDYTTVEARNGDLAIFARLRFGRSDLGVNGKRVAGWLQALAAQG
ncbi:DUF1499 domain-containing protein [Thalassovita taeanensis]|uniref:DUF1499 domain-containing protein n=1 Tax=Thalassovita taeanensis TaxID=657014 RepID=A0A1H8YZ38_9RHOB|nr:DUF1499 domain-containing protein [Thalassovita taeanensis]SEP57341.1 Protein of unknown function [Thalassovita taeanensis]